MCSGKTCRFLKPATRTNNSFFARSISPSLPPFRPSAGRLLAPIIVTSLSLPRNLAACYRASALSTQSSRFDFPPDRIIIAHQFRPGSRCTAMRCDLIVWPRVHNSLQLRRYRGCPPPPPPPPDATWINGVRVRKYSRSR